MALALVNEADLDVLRAVLKRARWDEQGGYPSLTDGKWDFISSGLPQASPAEWDALFRLAGIVPDEIVSNGSCAQCAHAVNGHERGYRQPCNTCARPKMTNFKPIAVVRRPLVKA
jgi:hypothetical protein